MNKAWSWHDWSLRSKLLAAGVLVQLVASALLVFGSMRLLQRTLEVQASSQATQVVALLDQAIAAPLAQRDYVTLQQTLDLVRSDGSVNYLVLWDHRGKIAAASGWDAGQPLPPRDQGALDLDRADTTLHLAVPVVIAGQRLGHVDLGLSTAGLRQARAVFLQRSIAIAAAALLVSMVALAAIAHVITRHLARLVQASQRVARGELDVQVPMAAGDEIGRLGASFNAMAATLQQRVAALLESRTQQQLHLQVARAERSRLATLLAAMQGGIVFFDAQGRVIYANASFARIWALPALAQGMRLVEIVPLIARQVVATDAAVLDQALHADTDLPASGCELHTLDQRIILQRIQPVAEGTEGTEGGSCIWFHDDVTQQRQIQQRAHQALLDPLTKLPNRRGLYEELQAALEQAASAQAPLALMFIDLDDFKYANDVGGHRLGDEILVAVARAMAGQMRRGETVARLGGDEFAVLCPGAGATEAAAIAARLLEAVAGLRFPAAMKTLRVGCSIGIAAYPGDARDRDDLVECADTAMYQAKQNGKNGWAAYSDDPLQTQAKSARIGWNTRIRRALQDQRLALHFQSVHRAVDLRIVHHEALLRMVDEDDPTRLFSAADFLQHAERSGKIRQIDRWVFETCVERLATLDPALGIAAHLSPRSLEDPGFPGYLREVLQRHDVDPRRLTIVLSETSALSDPIPARRWIDALHGVGCAVHLDGFGSGFNSLAHLKLLNVDAIEIDGTFVRGLQSDATSRIFVAAMIDIAHNLNKLAVAEHVEDAATLEILRGMGIDLVQGFHLGRPTARPADGRPTDGRPRGRLQAVAGSGAAGG